MCPIQTGNRKQFFDVTIQRWTNGVTTDNFMGKLTSAEPHLSKYLFTSEQFYLVITYSDDRLDK